MGYDVFMLDYRGYGKSESTISSQQQLYSDIQTVYNEITKTYDESKIVILGYSIGTGPAAMLASMNHPKLLILQAPYYNLTDMMKKRFPIIPTFILKYKFETKRYLKGCTMPIVIFHGDVDEVIYYGSSLKLQKVFKQADELITLKGQGHNWMSENINYLWEIDRILNFK
jgi:alpha-beta hydrolase superfamily lysophospholipase